MQTSNSCYKCNQPLVFDACETLGIGTKFLISDFEEPLESEVYIKLNDILKGHIEITHPLCQSCLDILHDQLDKELTKVDEDIIIYTQGLELITNYNKHQIEREPTDCQHEHNKVEEEQELAKKLEALKMECMKLDQDYKEALKESYQLTLLEEKLNQEYSHIIYDNIQTSDQTTSIKNQLQYVEDQIEKWNNVDPIKFVFKIRFEGPFGIINDFRLGRLPPNSSTVAPISWNEINAAWGQTLLLLNSLARKLKFEFDRYKLVPLGNHSYIKWYHDNKQPDVEPFKELPLYCTGGFKFFWDTKFDQAMVAFLECLQQVVRELELKDGHFNLPYKIDKGRLVEPSSGLSYSIKAQFNSEENWTKALKFTLTNMQWVQTCICSQY